MLKALARPFLRDRFLHLLLLIGAACCLSVPFRPRQWAGAIDWHTIITLAGLMMLTKGVELSGYFDVLGRRMVKRFGSERQLAMFMVSAAALLSTFLTNDVALFIIVPLTITLKKLCSMPVTRLIIFEALAVNAGSLLTPIGNPQNILLWGRSGLSFAAFTWQMAPLAGAMVASLLALCWFCFPKKALDYHGHEKIHDWQPRLVYASVALYAVFIVSLELKQEAWGLALVALGFIFLARRVLIRIDWSLLLVFMVMFIDVHLITRLPILEHALHGVSQLSQGGLFALGIALSQIISNVPATILLLNYVPASVLLAFAVNIGGFGLLPGSLANLIALRMANDRRIWVRFHFYSLPMLLWAALMGYGLLLLLT
ncbi:anion transporter [Enterobacteriaceae bacterium H20N1]|uniref:Anion transporter n=1 Tax=Dryocola boscaweniae TaxID=2925397 RepID=A0A9X2W674_9ENTR|nr:anion transporter [Dryocola boscaweniae]MCT4701312.1 anion transporter [Dryocola boscaweniae]MCT4718452.1 anion transporter [Dryocola boscaweniae]